MKKILIIEDERTFANIFQELLEMEGFVCNVAYSAEDAERYFDKLGNEIGIVILDLMMARTGSFAKRPVFQGETGDELYKGIREIAPGIPIIIVTAKIKENIMPRYFIDPKTDVFFKPVDAEMIATLIARLKFYDK